MVQAISNTSGENPGRAVDSNLRPDRRLLMGYLHKTSNTLCGIKGYASLIADRENPDGQAGRWARKILVEIERMEEIFRSVGDMTRGRQHPDAGIDLPQCVAQVGKDCVQILGNLNLKVKDIPRGEVLLPANDLALVLKEVLTNCSESPQPGSTHVEVEIGFFRGSDGRLFLDIRDNGCGLSREMLVQAPEPFITTKENHHGVGLTRVDTLMQMYGLEWRMESEEGHGTRVLVEVAAG